MRHRILIAIVVSAVFLAAAAAALATSGKTVSIKPVNGSTTKTVKVTGINKDIAKITICQAGACQAAVLYGGDIRLALAVTGVRP